VEWSLWMVRAMSPGQRIRAARLDADLTLVALGRALGVKYQQIQAWESGRRNPGRKHLPQLAAVLGLALEDLLPRLPPMPGLETEVSDESW